MENKPSLQDMKTLRRKTKWKGALEVTGGEEGLERKRLGRKCSKGVTKGAIKRRNECRNEISKEMGKEGAQRAKCGQGRSPEREGRMKGD